MKVHYMMLQRPEDRSAQRWPGGVIYSPSPPTLGGCMECIADRLNRMVRHVEEWWPLDLLWVRLTFDHEQRYTEFCSVFAGNDCVAILLKMP